jgi:4-hydroxybenzoate polyprenyltransferase
MKSGTSNIQSTSTRIQAEHGMLDVGCSQAPPFRLKPSMPRLRTFLVLGRVSNLPTLWSNCLAGWWLGGAGNAGKLPLLFAGTTLLYLGGMFLNDAFDVDFDRQHRQERPIPSGAISLAAVWRLGIAMLAFGMVCLICLGITTGALGAALLVSILIYDATHKLFTFSPVFMGLCRFLVYIIAASVATGGVTGWAIWCGLALMAYIIGLSFLARRESARGPLQYWPLPLLFVPILIALIMNAGGYRQTAALLSAIVALWVVRSLGPMLWDAERRVGRTVSGLLAGIVLVDLLAVADAPLDPGAIFLLLFLAALLLQRSVPAT